MHRTRATVAVFLSLLACGPSTLARDDRRVAAQGDVVARVNGEAVTRPELQRMRSNPLTRDQLAREGAQLDHVAGDAALDRVALRSLVHRRLLLQEAARRHVTVSDRELDEAIGALRRKFDDLKTFGTWVRAQGLDDPALFEAVRGDLVADRMGAALVEHVRVSDEKARRYHAAHREALGHEEVRLQIIVVRDRASAEQILRSLIDGGEEFARVARSRSLGKRAAQGGDTGWTGIASLPAPIRGAIDGLRPGEVIGPLQRGEDEHLVVRLHARRSTRAMTLEEARPEIERRLLPELRREALRAWLSLQEEKSHIELLAVEAATGRGT